MATEKQHRDRIVKELLKLSPDFDKNDATDRWLVKELSSTRARLDNLEKKINEK